MCAQTALTRSRSWTAILWRAQRDPSSISLCHELGLTGVSLSTYRVPVARLAAP